MADQQAEIIVQKDLYSIAYLKSYPVDNCLFHLLRKPWLLGNRKNVTFSLSPFPQIESSNLVSISEGFVLFLSQGNHLEK